MSDAEKEILKCTMRGMNVTDIANYRFRSVKTVCIQKKQVYAKLGIKNDISFWLDLYMKYQLKFSSMPGDCQKMSALYLCDPLPFGVGKDGNQH
ncbi:TPA: helix-turn-helix domain-containing protein [Escherichia coli]|nr:helix-turn-helix domain-containing protein [Escherichia coli]HAX5205123.1 helix-turn-helix domain-containing protein [Escherichia coli]